MTVQPTRDQLRALAGAATPGPWEYEWDEDEGEITVRAGTARVGEDGFAPGSYVTTDMILEHEDAWPEDSGEQHAAEAEYIAAARTALPQLLDQLDAAEQRIRDLTQEVKDERGAALDQMEQVRIRDARIRAVEDVLDTWMTYCQTEQTARALSDIRRALNGYTET